MEISLCSRECQKLVWPIQAVLCGPGKTNPFLFPPLSREEMHDAEERAKPVAFLFRGDRDSRYEPLEPALHMSPETLPTILIKLKEKTTTELASPSLQLILASIRASRELVIAQEIVIFERIDRARPVPCAVNELSSLVANNLASFWLDRPDFSSFPSGLFPFFHRFALFAFVTMKLLYDDYAEPAASALTQLSHDLISFITTAIHPDCGEPLLDRVKRLVEEVERSRSEKPQNIIELHLGSGAVVWLPSSDHVLAYPRET
ncbi:hypothetical protein JCM8547_003498 [Rhodosporidiobolus lusitaniae]